MSKKELKNTIISNAVPQKPKKRIKTEMNDKENDSTTKKICRLFCNDCKTQQNKGSTYCSNCGVKLDIQNLQQKQNQLVSEVEMLKKINQELTRLVFISEFATPQNYWIMMKINFDGNATYPLPSMILDASKSFLDVLGYPNLSNIAYCDLIPKHHQVKLDKSNFVVTVERKTGPVVQRISFEDDMYLKHYSGNYILAHIKGNFYFDSVSNLPSVRILYLDKILAKDIKFHEIPQRHSIPNNIKFECEYGAKLPEFLQQFSSLRVPHKIKQENNWDVNYTSPSHFESSDNISPSHSDEMSLYPVDENSFIQEIDYDSIFY